MPEVPAMRKGRISRHPDGFCNVTPNTLELPRGLERVRFALRLELGADTTVTFYHADRRDTHVVMCPELSDLNRRPFVGPLVKQVWGALPKGETDPINAPPTAGRPGKSKRGTDNA